MTVCYGIGISQCNRVLALNPFETGVDGAERTRRDGCLPFALSVGRIQDKSRPISVMVRLTEPDMTSTYLVES